MRYTLSRDTIVNWTPFNYMTLSWRLHYITLHYNKHHCNWSLFPVLVLHMNTTAATSGIHISYENRLTTATEIYFRRPHFIWAPVGHSISWRVRFAGSRGPVKPAFCQSRRGKLVIPEQFTVKTLQVSVGWRRGVNNGAHLFQSTTDIDIQNAHKTCKNAWNV